MRLFDDGVLEGAIDIHVHVGPDYMPRYADSITLAQEAADCGMKAVVTKCHLTSTVSAAHAANQFIPETRIIGSVSLNGTVGGLSPRTVVATIKSGGKVIWLPTVDAKYSFEKAKQGHWIKHYVNSSSFGYPTEQLTTIDDNGRLKPEVHEIIRICKEYDAVLCSGHISPQECLAIAAEAKKIGFKYFEITHPNAWIEDFTMDILKELVNNGAVISLSYGACSPHNGRQDPAEIVAVIREIGAENCIMMTDYGQVNSPSPVQGMRVFYYLLKSQGITQQELDMMIKINPARLLNI